ncbi:hypothetical protein [Thermoleptolyngbya sp. C42_A2020_037]|uniref:hypothetical protein n=1 Tax=Thermoleptolyngbya sp. C42_A2020_037 TaxID=2747799 RepID=UPI0019DB123F|nr:hypothetical protein [Thermoleptolyngbya sp. C42_A2020_037]MBF2086635.1 hypothetical protein [Thermoleptolyngbya sp. C42_A2020_037]
MHPYLSAIALHLFAPVPFGDRPSSLSTRTSGRSPPDTFRNLELLTQIYRDLKFASYPNTVGTFWLDPDLEEPSLCK